MTAYMVGRVDVTDGEKWMEYAKAAAPTVAAHGGKYIARGGAIEGLENFEDDGKRIVILEFPNMDAARTWYNSEEYQAAKAKREGAGYARFTMVEGYEG